MLFQVGPLEVVVALFNFIIFVALAWGLALLVRWLVWGRGRQAAAMRSLEERVTRVEAQLAEGGRSGDTAES